MSTSGSQIQCELHGTRPARTACYHVLAGVGCGVHQRRSGEDHAPHAWCDGCEASRVEQGGWTEKLVESASVEECCEVCFAECVLRNEGPEEVLAFGTSGDLDAYYAYAESCARVASAANDEADADWGMISYPRWDYSREAHTLTFSGKPGPDLVWDAAVAGTYDIEAETWMWVWGPEEPIFPVHPEIQRICVLGNVRKISRLWFFHVIQMSEAECWELTSVAMVLSGGKAVYRAPMDHLHVYMVLSNPRYEP